jgi:hypothetical protein
LNVELLSLLLRKVGSKERAEDAMDRARGNLGLRSDRGIEAALAAIALCAMGERPELVSRLLSWQEFEQFVSHLLNAWGYEVRRNAILRKPRAQIDLVAFGSSFVLSIDCKHWKRELSPSTARRFARGQLQRSSLLRRQLADPRPIASVILSFSDSEGGFFDGVAVVPVRVLRSFLESVESYSSQLELR